MPINKHVLSTRFDAASASYDHVASVQQFAAEFLLRQLELNWPNFNPQSVLELGAGSGYLSELILARFPQSTLILNDLSAKMLDRAKSRLNSAAITYVCGDFDELQFAEVDLLISNLALQWSTDLEKTLTKGYLSAKRFAFSGLLQGTFFEWDAVFKACQLPSPVHRYCTRREVETMLSALNPKDFFFATQTVRLSFENAHAIMRYLQNLGASLGQQALSVAELKRVIKQFQQPMQLTYQLFFALLVRRD